MHLVQLLTNSLNSPEQKLVTLSQVIHPAMLAVVRALSGAVSAVV
jgi:hypothetical protein